MFKILDYKIVHGVTPAIVSEQVGELIKAEWQPLGGICITGDLKGIEYAQSMVKYGEKVN